ncbi:MAG: hypothetical protein OEW11_06610 [Nitrospirota bacterium]|nr:hypothetical protein [Nitrospirota bacterium]
MTGMPHILLADPAPDRGDLAARLRARGVGCTVSRGLHSAMVQAAMRNPDLIVADLDTPGGCGAELRHSLTQAAHFRHTPFLSIGEGGDLAAGTPTERVLEHILECVAGRTPDYAPQPQAHAPAGPRQVAAPNTPLEELLMRLGAEPTATTITVVGPDGAVGEVLVRDGRPFHAVTVDGLWGPEALEAMRGWSDARVEPGQPPRAEAPHTLAEPPPAELADPTPADQAAVLHLLAELESVGVLRKVSP